MSNTCQTVSQVIPIEDDDDVHDEDVEVVFTNLNKSDVYRNLIYQKISQEIELLQAMWKHTVPNNYDQFKEEAKKLGFQYGDDVIHSAWQRIMKKYLMKLTSFPNNKAPVCLVRPLQPSIDISPPKGNAPLSSRHSSVTGPSSSPHIASTAIPIALLLNKSVSIENPHQRTECFTKYPKLIDTIEIDTDDTNSNDSVGKEVVSAPKIRYSKIVFESISKNKVSFDKTYSKEIKSKTGDFSSDLDKQILSKSRSEESSEIQSSFVNASPKNYFDCLVSEQNRLGENKKVPRRYSQKRKSPSKQVVPVDSSKTEGKTEKQIISAPESRCNKTDSEIASKNIVPSDKFSKKRRSETDTFSADLHKQNLSKSGSGEYDEIQNSLVSALSESYFHGAVSEQNQLGNMKKVTQKSSQKRKSSSKQVVPLDSPKTVDQAIAKSHVGVKAKIVRTKRTSQTNSRKRISKTIKEMSEAELKEFKAEQKRLKYEENRQFEMQQLQKVHDRLVDVLIPKYYNKNLNEKG